MTRQSAGLTGLVVPVVAAVVLLGACTAQPVLLPSRDFDRVELAAQFPGQPALAYFELAAQSANVESH